LHWHNSQGWNRSCENVQNGKTGSNTRVVGENELKKKLYHFIYCQLRKRCCSSSSSSSSYSDFCFFLLGLLLLNMMNMMTIMTMNDFIC
jgi:hypothetical protein